MSATASSAGTLDWEGFCADRFPHVRRHDFDAIVAYGSYRRSQAVGQRSLAAPSAPKANGSAGPTALQGWEDERGAA